MRIKKHIVLALLFAAAISLLAGKTSFPEEQKKLTVISKKQSIDYANRILIYEGEVNAAWANYTIEADKVEIYLTPQETLEKIVATSGVKITQDTKIQATCEKITYLPQKEILTLEGNVKYQDEIGNTLQAQKITVWIEEKKLLAEGSPVKATYILKEEESAAPGGESK